MMMIIMIFFSVVSLVSLHYCKARQIIYINEFRAIEIIKLLELIIIIDTNCASFSGSSFLRSLSTLLFFTVTSQKQGISIEDNIKDEIHSLFDCAKSDSSIRDDIANRIPNYKHVPISTLVIQLMNSTDYYLNKQLVQYVTSCLEMRVNLLSNA